eukprot:COSAG04_NODE_8500_length_965_cov_4.294457_2_plen_51_part_01
MPARKPREAGVSSAVRLRPRSALMKTTAKKTEQRGRDAALVGDVVGGADR